MLLICWVSSVLLYTLVGAYVAGVADRKYNLTDNLAGLPEFSVPVVFVGWPVVLLWMGLVKVGGIFSVATKPYMWLYGKGNKSIPNKSESLPKAKLKKKAK